MKYKPILDRILLRRVEQRIETFKTSIGPIQAVKEGSSIVKPPSYSESNKYEVLAVGDCVVMGGIRFDVKDFVNVGDVVLVPPYNVEEIEEGGLKFQSCRVQDVRGKQIGALQTSLAS